MSTMSSSLELLPDPDQIMDFSGADLWNSLQAILKSTEEVCVGYSFSTKAPVRVRSGRSTRARFDLQPLLHRRQVLLALLQTCFALSEMRTGQESPKNAKRFLWRVFRNLGLVPPNNLLDTIGDEDVIEVYSSQGVQIFRSFSLLELTSYSIEDLIVYSWGELFYRDPNITMRLMDQAGRLFSNEIKSIQRNEVTERHVVKELQSDERRKIELEFAIVSPIATVQPSSIKYFVSTFTNARVLHD